MISYGEITSSLKCDTRVDLSIYCVQVLSVTYIKAGNSTDTTPPVVEFGGTLRSLTTEGLYRLEKRLKEVSIIMAQINSLRGTPSVPK